MRHDWVIFRIGWIERLITEDKGRLYGSKWGRKDLAVDSPWTGSWTGYHCALVLGVDDKF